MPVVFILVFTLAYHTALLSAETGIRLCRTGCYHAGEIPADFSGLWYGIFNAEANTYELKKIKPVVVPCSDPVFDTGEDTLSGREVLIRETSENPLLLISGMVLEEGSIETSFINQPRCLFPGDYIRFYMNNNEYALMATGTIAFDTIGKRLIPFVKDYRLLLVKNMYHEPVVQEIVAFDQLYAGEEVQPAIFFAGDIDRDGKPDLLFDLSTHYNVSNVTLFLSGSAEAGKLVKEVASWNTTGC